MEKGDLSREAAERIALQVTTSTLTRDGLVEFATSIIREMVEEPLTGQGTLYGRIEGIGKHAESLGYNPLSAYGPETFLFDLIHSQSELIVELERDREKQVRRGDQYCARLLWLLDHSVGPVEVMLDDTDLTCVETVAEIDEAMKR